MEWGKEEERECRSGKVSVEEVECNIRLGKGLKGRIIWFRADVAGKIGSKVRIYIEGIAICTDAISLPL